MRREWLITAVLGLWPWLTLPAQQAAAPFARWEAPAMPAPPDSLPAQRGDYRYEGLAFGGLVFGALGAWLGSRDYASCALEPGGGCSGNNDKVAGAVALGLVGAAVGGGLGYLVGRFSPKKPRPDSLPTMSAKLATVPDSLRIRVGYQHWRGAGMGLAIGTGIGVVTGALLSTLTTCDDCREASAGEAAVMLGLLGAGAGGVVGFLAGLSSPKYITIPATSPTE
jgi:hypothetical protein